MYIYPKKIILCSYMLCACVKSWLNSSPSFPFFFFNLKFIFKKPENRNIGDSELEFPSWGERCSLCHHPMCVSLRRRRSWEAAVALIASSSKSHRFVVANMVPASLVLLTFLCLAMRLSSNYLMALVSSPMVSPMLNYVTKTLELRVWCMQFYCPEILRCCFPPPAAPPILMFVFGSTISSNPTNLDFYKN